MEHDETYKAFYTAAKQTFSALPTNDLVDGLKKLQHSMEYAASPKLAATLDAISDLLKEREKEV